MSSFHRYASIGHVHDGLPGYGGMWQTGTFAAVLTGGGPIKFTGFMGAAPINTTFFGMNVDYVNDRIIITQPGIYSVYATGNSTNASGGTNTITATIYKNGGPSSVTGSQSINTGWVGNMAMADLFTFVPGDIVELYVDDVINTTVNMTGWSLTVTKVG